MALALTDKEECEKRAKEPGTSHFSAKKRTTGFVKYMDYLYDEGYLDPELTPASLAAAQGILWRLHTWPARCPQAEAQARFHQKQQGPGLSGRGLVALMKVPFEETGPGGKVEMEAVLYGTPSNLDQAESWTAYTTVNFGFQGLALDAFLDCEIRFLARGGR